MIDLYKKKFAGHTYYVRQKKKLAGRDRFSGYELGLHDINGNVDKAPLLRIISKGKAAGCDKLLDTILWENKAIRDELFYNVY